MAPGTAGSTSNQSTGSTAQVFLEKDEAVRAVVGLTCCLSILGSILITFSYVCFKSLRTRARLILVHISVMDFGVAAANLIGLSVYFDQYYQVVSPEPSITSSSAAVFVVPPKEDIRNLCVAQAFFAVFFTYGSILWTVCLSLHLYFSLVYYDKPLTSRWFLLFAHFFSYSMSLLVSLWLLLTDKLGYSPYNSSGWCSIILVEPATQKKNIYTAILGYDLWIYLTLALVPIVYLALKGYLQDQYERNKDYITEQRFWEAVYILDYKFMLIPLTFTILRVWTCIVNILYVYAPSNVSDSIPSWITTSLVYLSGIGDSGQGIVNAFLFILCTSTVRRTFQSHFCSWFTKRPPCFKRKAACDQREDEIKDPTHLNSSTAAEQTPIQYSSFEFCSSAHEPEGSVNQWNLT